MRITQHAADVVSAAGAVVVGLGWDKLLVVMATIAAITALIIHGDVEPEPGIGIFSAILGYVFGRASTSPDRHEPEE